MTSNNIILFDGVCNLCSHSVKFVLNNEKNSKLKFASIQSAFSKTILLESNIDTEKISTIVFIENNQLFFKSKAVFKITKYLKFPFKWIIFLNVLPLSFTDFLYEFIAKNRYNIFGKSKQCFIPSEELKERFIE